MGAMTSKHGWYNSPYYEDGRAAFRAGQSEDDCPQRADEVFECTGSGKFWEPADNIRYPWLAGWRDESEKQQLGFDLRLPDG